MSIIKENIRFTGENMNLKIVLNSRDNFIGYQQEIDGLTQLTTTDLINPAIDGETRRFKYDPDLGNTVLSFYFYSGNTYNVSFLNAGFTQNEINSNSNKLLNSFFILDFYDTFDVNNQTKIFTTYLTKILDNISNSPIYRVYVEAINQFYYWYIPLSYINTLTGSTGIGYVKFSFYNAKNGNVSLFYNNDNAALTTAEKMFFKVELNLTDKTWKFLTTSFPYLTAYELITSIDYINRINNTFEKFDNKKQEYPTGTTFNYRTGTYLTI